MKEDISAHGAEQLRAAQSATSERLRSAGIDLDDRTDPGVLESVLDAVERFERAVRSRGGDLMVDEPPPGNTGEPDDPRFVLPKRRDDENIEGFRNRILAAARAIEVSA